MQTTSAEFTAIMKDAVGAKFSRRRIRYKRRYWNGSAFVYEAAFRELHEDDVVSVSPVSWRLDVRQQNKILASNVTLRLRNQDWRWLLENITVGEFRPDAVAAIGYDDFKMEVKLDYGYLLADGTVEYVTIFSGFATDFLFDSDALEAEIQVEGREHLLEHANAQEVHVSFANEPAVPATGNGTNARFKTKLSVWEVSKVRVAGVDKVQGVDYKLENVNQGDAEAEIVFETAAIPTAGQAVDWTGSQWKRNKKVSELVADLCDEAGIGAGERVIIEPTFPGATQFVEYGSQAQWDAAAKTGTNSVFKPGFLQLGKNLDNAGFETGAFAPAWGTSVTSGGSADIIGPGSFEGTKHARLGVGESGPATFSGKAAVMLTSSPTPPTSFPPFGAIFKELADATDWSEETIVHTGGTRYLHFAVYDNTDHGLRAVITHQTALVAPQTITFRYKAESPFTIFPSYVFLVDDVRARVIAATGEAVTAEIDLLVTPEAFLPLVHSTNLNGGTVAFETQTAAISGGPYSAFVATDGALVPQSPVNRFIKVKVKYTDNGALTDGPDTDFLRVRFLSSNLLIGHADFKGKTVLAAIQRLAEIANAEFGFRGSGNFFFRPKAVSPVAALSLDQGNFISKVRSLRRGYDFVQNLVTIAYGPYYHEESVATQSPPLAEPNTEQRFGRVLLAKAVNDLLFANNADFAQAMARNYFNDFSRPRRRWVVESRIIPPLELSDVLETAFYDSSLRKDSFFGDQQNPNPAFGTDFRNLLRATLGKTLGISFNTDDGTCSIELQEVLT